MSRSKVKICGISNIDVLKELIEIGIDYVGFIFYSKSPRYVDIDFLETLKDIDFKNTRPVCVYVNPDKNYVFKTSSYLQNPVLQFHGDEDAAFCESFELDYWKALRIGKKKDLELKSLYQSADAILLENHKDGMYGGTGESFNWEILHDHKNEKQNFVLSGGINLENVDNALKTNSWCLDINSGVESSEGVKDIKLIKHILEIINNYDFR
jgi:phosphoribosylanthranilate isomerase